MPFSNVAKLHHAILSFMTYWFNILRSLLSGRFTRLDSIEYQKKLNFRVIIVSQSMLVNKRKKGKNEEEKS